jgi:hypothetical protein
VIFVGCAIRSEVKPKPITIAVGVEMSVLEAILGENDLSEIGKRGVSLLFLGVAAVLAYCQYSGPWWGELNIAPKFISGVVATAIIAPLYLRGILKWEFTIYGILSFLLISIAFASLVEFALAGGGFEDYIIKFGIIFAVVVSWLGIKGVASISWIVLFAVVVFNIIKNDDQMGGWGFLYFVCIFLGLLLHSGLGPGALVESLQDEYDFD